MVLKGPFGSKVLNFKDIREAARLSHVHFFSKRFPEFELFCLSNYSCNFFPALGERMGAGRLGGQPRTVLCSHTDTARSPCVLSHRALPRVCPAEELGG